VTYKSPALTVQKDEVLDILHPDGPQIQEVGLLHRRGTPNCTTSLLFSKSKSALQKWLLAYKEAVPCDRISTEAGITSNKGSFHSPYKRGTDYKTKVTISFLLPVGVASDDG
jgi:hypothetical protein